MKSHKHFAQTSMGITLDNRQETIFSDVIVVNPTRTLKKGINAKYVSMADIQPFKKQIVDFVEREYKSGPKFMNGDTLFARITPCLENGKTAFVDFLKNGEVGFGSTEFIVLSAKENCTVPEFVYYVARSPEVRDEAIKSMTGTSGRQRVENAVFDSIQLMLPTLSEQSAISKILSDLDAKIELNQKMNKTLEAIGLTIFKHWFVDFEFPNDEGKPYKSFGGEMIYNEELGKEIPEGWEIKQIGTVLKTTSGGTPSKEIESYWQNGTIAWINSGKVKDFRIIEPVELITKEAMESSSTKLVPKHSTVLAITGATLGQVSLLEIDSCISQNVVAILSTNSIPSEFIYFWMKHIINDLISKQTGGAQQHINKRIVDESPLLIPDRSSMKVFDTIMPPIFQKIRSTCYEIHLLANIRDALLPKLMSGKIRVALGDSK